MSHLVAGTGGWSTGRIVAVVGRVFGWGILGAVCGLLLGLGVGIIHAPLDVPGDLLANEWYTPFDLIVIMPLEFLAGLLIGAGIALGVTTPAGRRRSFAFALLGAVIGAGLMWVVAHLAHVILIDWRDASELMSSLIVQAVGLTVGLIVAASLGTSAPLKKGPIHSDFELGH